MPCIKKNTSFNTNPMPLFVFKKFSMSKYFSVIIYCLTKICARHTIRYMRHSQWKKSYFLIMFDPAPTELHALKNYAHFE